MSKFIDKSKKYKGVYQQKKGLWCYRCKVVPMKGHGRIESDKPVYLQAGGFPTEDAANVAKIEAVKELMRKVGGAGYREPDIHELLTEKDKPYFIEDHIDDGKEPDYPQLCRTFATAFEQFLDATDSDNSKKKYKSLYNQNLTVWNDIPVNEITAADIETMLLSLSLQGKRDSYIAHLRKMLNLFFAYENLLNLNVSGDIMVGIGTGRKQLKVLNLYDEKDIEYALQQLLPPIKSDNRFSVTNYSEMDFDNINPYADYDLVFWVEQGVDKDDAVKIANIIQPKFILLYSYYGDKNFADTIKRFQNAGYTAFNNFLHFEEEYKNPQTLISVCVRSDIHMAFRFPLAIDYDNDMNIHPAYEHPRSLTDDYYDIYIVLKALIEQLCKTPSQDSAVKSRKGKRRKKKDYIVPFIAYEGNKTKLLPSLFEYFPKDLESLTFVDLFAGAATVSVNVPCKKIVVNELDSFLTEIYETMLVLPPDTIWDDVEKEILHYDLTSDYIGKDAYYRFRYEYNLTSKEERAKQHFYAKSLALAYHSFNGSHITHNKQGDYNSSHGAYENGTKINLTAAKEKFFPYASKFFSHSDRYTITNLDFRAFDFSTFNPKTTFIYVDPPYLISNAAYNKGGSEKKRKGKVFGWTEDDDKALYALLDELDRQGFRWMLSNVVRNKKRGKEEKHNAILDEWMQRYHVEHLDRSYANSIGTKRKDTSDNATSDAEDKGYSDEVIVYNY